ncbi:MAG: outer membrane protein assembly factor BamD [Thermodesulfovibrionales bacterium]|jgi:outer membrane protein assembly factor BamD
MVFYTEGLSKNPKFFLRMLCILLTFVVFSCSAKKEIRPEGEFNADKYLAMANELIEKKDYEDARRLLLEVKNRDLTKKYAPLAQLLIADTYTKEEENDLAVQEYKRFIEIYPDHQNASYAQYQIAMIYFNQIESPERGYGAAAKALEEFEKLKKTYPRNPYKELIELRIDKCKTTMADYEFLVGEYYFKKGSYKAALGRFQSLRKNYPDFKKEPLVLFHIALSQKNIGSKDKAIEYLNLLIEKYPNDQLVKEAKKTLAGLSK